MTTPDQAPSRRIEILIQEIVKYCVMVSVDTHTLPIRIPNGVPEYTPLGIIATCWTNLANDDKLRVVDELIALGWCVTAKPTESDSYILYISGLNHKDNELIKPFEIGWRIFRTEPRNRSGYLETIIGVPTVDYIKPKYGGGVYNCLRYSGGAITQKETIHVMGDPR